MKVPTNIRRTNLIRPTPATKPKDHSLKSDVAPDILETLGTLRTSLKSTKGQKKALLNEQRNFSRGGELRWQCVAGPAPEKVFLWDGEGTYVDCQYPNPLYGHFLGGVDLVGKQVREILPPKAALDVLNGIRRAFMEGEPSQCWIILLHQDTDFEVCIRFIPSGRVVIGWVNEFPIPARLKTVREEKAPLCTLPFSTSGGGLTNRQRTIIREVSNGQSNHDIAVQLGISEEEVRVHLTSLYQKLYLFSRMQLAHLGEALLTLPPSHPVKPTLAIAPSNFSDSDCGILPSQR